MPTSLVVNGKPWSSIKSARSMDALVRAGQSAASLEEWDAAMESYTDACESGALTMVEAEVVGRSLGRQLDRLEGAPVKGATLGPGDR